MYLSHSGDSTWLSYIHTCYFTELNTFFSVLTNVMAIPIRSDHLSMMLPPPCFTVRMVFSRSWELFFLLVCLFKFWLICGYAASCNSSCVQAFSTFCNSISLDWRRDPFLVSLCITWKSSKPFNLIWGIWFGSHFSCHICKSTTE